MTPEIATLRSNALTAGNRAARAWVLFQDGTMARDVFESINAAADAAWAAFNAALPN